MTAQVAPADDDHALDLQQKYRGLAIHLPAVPVWIEGTHRFVYSRTAAEEDRTQPAIEFVRVDADKRESRLAFDHARLAEALTKTLGTEIQAQNLPLRDLKFTGDEKSLEFLYRDVRWTCDLNAYTCAKKAALSPTDEEFEGDDYDTTPKGLNGEAHAKTSPGRVGER